MAGTVELLVLNRPVAARAALERVIHFDPANPELRAQFEALFGNESRLPLCARRAYSFRPTAKRRHRARRRERGGNL